jgi:hypothetical protein
VESESFFSGYRLDLEPPAVFEDDNPKRVPATWSDTDTKLTDIAHCLTNQDAVHDILQKGDHDDDAMHAERPISEWVEGWESPDFADENLPGGPSSTDDTVPSDWKTGLLSRYSPTNIDPVNAADIPQMSGDIFGGIALCRGLDTSGGKAEAVMSFSSGGMSTSTAQTLIIRRSPCAGGSDFKPLSVGTERMAFRLGGFPGVDGASENPLVVRRDLVTATGAPYARNLVDRYHENARAIHDAMGVRHDPRRVSKTIAMEEFREGVFFNATPTTIDRTQEFTQIPLGPHGGEYYAIIPWACGLKSGGGAHALMPAWNDTHMYLVAWIPPGYTDTGSDLVLAGATAFRLDPPSAASLPGTFDGAFAVAQGDALDQDLMGALEINDGVNATLYSNEHRPWSGLHSIGVDKLAGYAVNSDTFLADPAVGGIKELEILHDWTDRDEDPVLLFSIVGEPGAGIVSVTFGGDEHTVYAWVRTITIGTTRNYSHKWVFVDRL